ncbi:SRPBCC family protein [Hoeflea prorocentri]|uniref:SRPBCC family protein n=1 Tax=Hoeflea prorocentri TaxID=1922333 RepID=A0A9X3UGS7_9HYPH|nr:SRPBCC family protein [Hoeflea prorocentri]MCY6381032.1 SRPBCC family protein [Hoeflea prorocentri]MDA5398832.1 SRPBCC family protein [Hoeflea prorocentri]
MKIDKNYELPFSPERVFAAWTSSETVIPPATRMDINPTVGGHFRLIIEGTEHNSVAEGLFFAVEPDRHVRYTWEWDRSGEITQIDVRFEPADAGTDLRIVHTGFQKQESLDMHDSGWDSYVEALSVFLKEDGSVEPH